MKGHHMTINQHRAHTLRLHLAACLIFAAMALPAFATPGDVKNPDGTWSQPGAYDKGWNDSATGCHAGDCNPEPKKCGGCAWGDDKRGGPIGGKKPKGSFTRAPEREGSGLTTPHDGRAYAWCKWADGRRYISVKTAGVHHADQSAWAVARRQLAHDQCRAKLGVK